MSVATPPHQRSRIGIQIAILAALGAVAFLLQRWYGLRNNFFDLMIYRDAMRWWVDGNPLYDFSRPDQTQGELGFTYPPFAALLFRPLAWLTPGATRTVFVVIAILAFAATIWWLVRPLADRRGWPRWFTAGLALILASGLEPIRLSFDFGQVNFILWALIVVDLAVLLPRRSRFLGVGIGLATAIKLIPGIFVLYLLITRRWRAAAVSAGTAAAASLISAAFFPHDSWTFWGRTMLHGDGVGQRAYPMNQSLQGFLARLAEPDQPNTLLWLALCIPVLAFGMWRAARASAAGDELTALALTGFVGSLLSPISWVHHLFWFVPALLALVESAIDRRRPALAVVAVFTYATVTMSMIQWWDFTLLRPGGLVGFVLSNWVFGLMLMLLVVLPIQPRGTVPRPEPQPFPDQVAVSR